ncbi:MAG: VOC family protein [Flavisolibacter sp.]
MQKIAPFLWFNDQAEEVMLFYISIFKNSRAGKIHRGAPDGSGHPGKVGSVSFYLEDQQFMGINGGPHFNFSPAISFFVNCSGQIEVDELYDKLSQGGEKQKCGWLKDKFGVSWQIIPAVLGELLNGSPAIKSKKVFEAMCRMENIDIEKLKAA